MYSHCYNRAQLQKKEEKNRTEEEKKTWRKVEKHVKVWYAQSLAYKKQKEKLQQGK